MSPRLQTIAGVIVYGLTLVALVVLLVVGRPVDSVMLLAGPVVAALLVTGQITDRLNPIHDAVSKIDEQTNGVLGCQAAPDAQRPCADCRVIPVALPISDHEKPLRRTP